MKKILSLILVLTSILVIGLNSIKAAETKIIVGFEELEEGIELEAGYYAIKVDNRDPECEDFEQANYYLNESFDNVSNEIFTHDNYSDVLADIGLTTNNQDVIEMLCAIEEASQDRWTCVIIIQLVDSWNYDTFYKELPDQHGVYKLIIDELPEIDVSDEVHILDYDKHFTLEDIKAKYSATDNYDKDLTSQIKFESNFPTTEENYKIGEYYITATVTDSSNNTTSVTNKIYLVDITLPKFNVEVVSKEYKYGEDVTLEEIFSEVTCVDNYDGNIPITNWKLSKEIDTSILTQQNITVTAQDSSGNESSFKLNIIFKDTDAPVISVDTIDLSTNNPLTEEQLINVLVETKNIPNNYISYKLTTDYFDYQNEVGIHDATLELEYENNVRKTYKFKINVTENEDPNSNNSPNYLPYIIGGVVGTLVIVGVVAFILRRRLF